MKKLTLAAIAISLAACSTPQPKLLPDGVDFELVKYCKGELTIKSLSVRGKIAKATTTECVVRNPYGSFQQPVSE